MSAAGDDRLGATDEEIIDSLREEVQDLESANARLDREVERLQQWVQDLQSGMYVNCVYCGHRYGPDGQVAVSMADVLKQHIEQCSQHPMAALKAELEKLQLLISSPNITAATAQAMVRFWTTTAERRAKEEAAKGAA